MVVIVVGKTARVFDADHVDELVDERRRLTDEEDNDDNNHHLHKAIQHRNFYVILGLNFQLFVQGLKQMFASDLGLYFARRVLVSLTHLLTYFFTYLHCFSTYDRRAFGTTMFNAMPDNLYEIPQLPASGIIFFR